MARMGRSSTFQYTIITRVTKYHRTLTTYLGTLLQNGFQITGVVEPAPPEDMMDIPGMKDELRRPMMLLVSAKKQLHGDAQSQEGTIC